MVDSNRTRQKRFFESQKSKGLHQVRIWVPAELVDDIKVLVGLYCKAATKKETKDA